MGKFQKHLQYQLYIYFCRIFPELEYIVCISSKKVVVQNQNYTCETAPDYKRNRVFKFFILKCVLSYKIIMLIEYL